MREACQVKGARARALVLAAAMLGCGGGVDPSVAPHDLEKLVRACAILSGCQGEEVRQCVGTLRAQATAAQVDCVLAATLSNCTAANACVGLRRSTDPSCAAGCLDADTVVSCAGTLRTEIECASSIESLGPACISRTRTACGTGECAADAITCNGHVMIRCASGVADEYDCARLGMECAQGRGCVGVAAGPCTAEPRCDGNVIVDCEAGLERRIDCTEQIPGSTCGVVVNNIIGCVLGEQCNAIQTPDSCVGTTLQSCVAGAPKSVDCTSIGGTSCGYSDTHAHCMP